MKLLLQLVGYIPLQWAFKPICNRFFGLKAITEEVQGEAQAESQLNYILAQWNSRPPKVWLRSAGEVFDRYVGMSSCVSCMIAN